MKVGDLVELSASGKKLQLNEHATGKTGLVTHCYGWGESAYVQSGYRNAAYSQDEYCLDVLWSGAQKTQPHSQVRSDLKHMK